MDYKDFFNSIKLGAVASLYLFYGQEEYIKNQALERLKETLLPESTRDLNLVVLDGEVAEIDDIIAAAETLPIMSSRRLVVVKDFATLTGKSSQNTSSEKKLQKYISFLPEYLCLVFVCRGDIPKHTALYKALCKYGMVIDFAPLKEKDLILWLRTAFKRLGKSISMEDAQYMMLMAGTHLETLHQEVYKLVSYIGDKKLVTAKDIDEMVTKIPAANVFKMVDAIGYKDIEQALWHLHCLLEAGESPIGLVAMIARQFRLLLHCRLLLEQGLGIKQIVSYLKLPVFVVNGYIKQLNNFNTEQLTQALKSCLKADLTMKSTTLEQRFILEKLIVTVCGANCAVPECE